jgi:serine protease Do
MMRMTLNNLIRTLWLAAAICGLSSLSIPAKEAASSALDLARQLNQAFIEVADQVSPAVVVIRVAHKQNFVDMDDEENPFWDMLPPEFRKKWEEKRENKRHGGKETPFHGGEPMFDGQGSGVVIREEGYILTNRHVVDGADKIRVRFKDGAEFDAEVRGVDAQSDVAVIKVDLKGKKLTVAKMGDSGRTRVGEFAIAIGAPFDLDYSVTFGHVSAKGRSSIIGGREGQSMDQDFIQTDANINPGNSGGPLVNVNSEVIGINTLIRGLHTGIGFAIPSNLAREVSDKLISDGKYVRAWLGIGVVPLKEFAEYRDLAKGTTDGVVVRTIEQRGPAAKSKLRPADIITTVDGKPVSNAQQLRSAVRSKSLGSTITLEVVRGGRNMKIDVKTDAWPEDATPVANSKKPAPTEESTRSLGLTVRPLTKELMEQYGVEKTDGVIVTEVEKGSVAEQFGLSPGDIITEVDHESVTTPKQFKDALKRADPKKGIVLNFTSKGVSKFEFLKDSGD